MSARVSVVLLAAGYGTRLYPLTKEQPKALLKLGRQTILDWMVEELATVPKLSQTVLVSNHRFAARFRAWQRRRRWSGQLLDDGSTSPDTRLGAIRDLQMALARIDPRDDVLVLGTDNVFAWSLADLVRAAKTVRPAATVAVRQVDSAEEARRCAVVSMARTQRLRDCVEKPAHPSSLTVALCIYYFPSAMRHRIDQFVREGGNADAPGYFIEWLVKQESVYGFMTQGAWFDIGTHESYRQAARQWADRTAHPSRSRSQRPTTHATASGRLVTSTRRSR